MEAVPYGNDPPLDGVVDAVVVLQVQHLVQAEGQRGELDGGTGHLRLDGPDVPGLRFTAR